MRFRVLGRRAALFAFAGLLAASGCKKKETTPAPSPLPVPARPSELLAELQVPRPSESWPLLQALLGSPVTFLPKAPELSLGAWLSLSPLVASSLDLRAPLVAVVLALAEPAWVLGVRLESGPEFVAQLTTGSAPTHRVKREGGLALLTALTVPDALPLAVQGDALLIGPRSALLLAGSYVARVLLPKATPEGKITASVSGGSLRTLAVPALRALWQGRQSALREAQRRAEQEHGRPADFADPSVLLAGIDQGLESAFAVLSSAEQATGELAFEGDSLEFVVRLRPAPSGAAADWTNTLPLGSTEALGALPARTSFGLLLRRLPEPATRDLADRVTALFGKRLSASDERTLRESLGALDAGRGNVQVVGLLDDLSLIWRGEVRDANLLQQGFKNTIRAFSRPPLSAPVAAFAGQPTLSQSTVRIPSVDALAERAVLRLTPPAAAQSKTVRQLELLWLLDSSRFLAVASSGTKPSLAEASAAEHGANSLLGSDSAARFLSRSPRAALLMFADLGRLASGASAPLTFAVGKSEDGPEFSLRVSQGALRVLVSRGLAL